MLAKGDVRLWTMEDQVQLQAFLQERFPVAFQWFQDQQVSVSRVISITRTCVSLKRFSNAGGCQGPMPDFALAMSQLSRREVLSVLDFLSPNLMYLLLDVYKVPYVSIGFKLVEGKGWIRHIKVVKPLALSTMQLHFDKMLVYNARQLGVKPKMLQNLLVRHSRADQAIYNEQAGTYSLPPAGYLPEVQDTEWALLVRAHLHHVLPYVFAIFVLP
jgi:hypothetical protein